MTKGILFEIREFTVQDGPGIRTSVFFKGCPLRCVWCHNPEGQTGLPQLLINRTQCTNCGACRRLCPAADDRGLCTSCGRCTRICPQNARRLCGFEVRDNLLVQQLLRQKDLYHLSGGGVTLTGGEPLFQPDMARSLAERLQYEGIHVAMETCGYASTDVFRSVINHLDLLYLDIKMINPEQHRKWTGFDNGLILANMELLRNGPLPFIVRVPVIPKVNDSDEERRALDRLLQNASALQNVEFLPFNFLAGSKYPLLDRTFQLKPLK